MRKVFLFMLSLLMIVAFCGSSVRGDSIESISAEREEPSFRDNVGFYDTTLIAFDANDPDDPDYPGINFRAAYFPSVISCVQNYRNCTPYFESAPSFDKDVLIERMQNCNIFFIHTHGSSGTIKIRQSYPYFLYTTDLENKSLSNLLCAVLLSCDSGKTIPSANNMVQIFVNRGATTVVGFNDVISVDDANAFASLFASYTMDARFAVAYSIQLMSWVGGMSSICSAAVVGGDPYTTLD